MLTSKLTEIMDDKGLTVLALADKAGISTRTVMRARGQMVGRCTLDTLVTVATTLGVGVKDLFEEE
uniref:HTH cro/C1-type domain-containing protein n=1 Tax=Desulfovibrio sp. U5L TaxID=596152 RepID=I2PZY9_9BACT